MLLNTSQCTGQLSQQRITRPKKSIVLIMRNPDVASLDRGLQKSHISYNDCHFIVESGPQLHSEVLYSPQSVLLSFLCLRSYLKLIHIWCM